MRAEPVQLDVFGHEAARKADANRRAADSARVAYNFPASVREERVQHYLAEAEKWQAIANQATGGNTL